MESDSLLPKMPNAGSPSSTRRYIVGVGILLCVVSLWTIGNFVTAHLQTGSDSYTKPFLITYINTASYAFYLIPYILSYRKRRDTSSTAGASAVYERLGLETSPAVRTTVLDGDGTQTPLSPPPATPIEGHFVDDKLSLRETAQIAVWWGVVWFLANYALNASLAWTSVASVTILSSTCGFFTLILGSIMGIDTISRVKVIATVASFMGVLLVTQSDSTVSTASEIDLPTHPILGDIGTLLSAMLYAVYTVMLKWRVGDEERADMRLMLGLVGLYNIVFLLPAFPILHLLDIETFALPPSRDAWFSLLINAFIALLSDYLYVIAMLKTTPMLVTLGLSLTIPLAIIGSLFVPSSASGAITWVSLTGAALVLAGFVVLGWQGLESALHAPPPNGDAISEGLLAVQAEHSGGDRERLLGGEADARDLTS